MKIIKKLVINNIEKQLIDTNILLELSGCGRGFIVVNAEQSEILTNTIVKIDLGYYGSVSRWFTGYVESEQPAKKGTKKLIIRELIGVYSREFNCSFQHPTIKDITNWLTANYQLKFDLPDKDYINTKIPHFKHSGTGNHLLKAIGEAFNIADYVFYQNQVGTIYLGSYSDCYYGDKQIDLGDDLNKMSLSTTGVNTIVVPFVPKIRPGVILNNRIVKEVNLINDELHLTFDGGNRDQFKKQLSKSNPEISAGYHLPMFGRVVAISDICNTGNISTPFRPRYAVDVQLLDENGEDSSALVFKAVPLPVALGSWEKGAFCYPDIGSVVDIAFAYGRADQPIIRNVYPVNVAVPAIKHGEILIQQRPEVYQRIDKVGNITRETDQELRDVSRDHYITADNQDNNIIERKTTISANDEINVLGNRTVNAGAIAVSTIQDFGIGTGANYYHYVKQNYELTIDANYTLKANAISVAANNDIQVIAKQISEKADTIYSIVAGNNAQIMAPSIWLGSSTINATQCMLDTLDLVKRLADLTAAHVHGNSSPPNNGSAISALSKDAASTNDKYSSIIAK
ncbi:hypothetical protein RHO14_07055 [Orbus wheelerorum]|uniref:hypothetical protein n=1 Tax=Orbus wheelerorum TaxID=3074111 RepID=UPI00370DCB42